LNGKWADDDTTTRLHDYTTTRLKTTTLYVFQDQDQDHLKNEFYQDLHTLQDLDSYD